MDEQEPIQVVELRISYRYATAHPWVVQAIGGFLSAYFMEHPGFRVQRHMEELESGAHLWVCEVPPSMKVLRLLKRLKEDIPPCHAQQIATDLPARPRYLIDCPESARRIIASGRCDNVCRMPISCSGKESGPLILGASLIMNQQIVQQ